MRNKLFLPILFLLLFMPTRAAAQQTFASRQANNNFTGQNTFAGVKIEWSNAATYQAYQIVSYMGVMYQSIAGANLNHTPTDSMYWTPVSSGGGGSFTGGVVPNPIYTATGSRFDVMAYEPDPDCPSELVTTGSITNGSSTLTLAGAAGFMNGCYIVVFGIGDAPDVATPVGSSGVYAPQTLRIGEVAALGKTDSVFRTSNVVTIISLDETYLSVGQVVAIAGVTGCATSPNGSRTITATPDAWTIQFSQAGPDEICSKGTITPPTSGATTYTYKVIAIDKDTGSSAPESFTVTSSVAVLTSTQPNILTIPCANDWNSGTTYGLGARVLYDVAGTDFFFRSLSAGNTNHLPTDTMYWFKYDSTSLTGDDESLAWNYAIWETSPATNRYVGLAQPCHRLHTTTTFIDRGGDYAWPPYMLRPFNFAFHAPPTTATRKALITTISSGGGTTTLTLAAPAQATVTDVEVMHDDTIPIKNAIAAIVASGGIGGEVYLAPSDKFMRFGNLNLTAVATGTVRMAWDGTIAPWMTMRFDTPIYQVVGGAGCDYISFQTFQAACVAPGGLNPIFFVNKAQSSIHNISIQSIASEEAAGTNILINNPNVEVTESVLSGGAGHSVDSPLKSSGCTMYGDAVFGLIVQKVMIVGDSTKSIPGTDLDCTSGKFLDSHWSSRGLKFHYSQGVTAGGGFTVDNTGTVTTENLRSGEFSYVDFTNTVNTYGMRFINASVADTASPTAYLIYNVTTTGSEKVIIDGGSSGNNGLIGGQPFTSADIASFVGNVGIQQNYFLGSSSTRGTVMGGSGLGSSITGGAQWVYNGATALCSTNPAADTNLPPLWLSDCVGGSGDETPFATDTLAYFDTSGPRYKIAFGNAPWFHLDFYDATGANKITLQPAADATVPGFYCRYNNTVSCLIGSLTDHANGNAGITSYYGLTANFSSPTSYFKFSGAPTAARNHTIPDIADSTLCFVLNCINDTAYNEATYNGVTDRAPSMNVFRDTIEALILGGGTPTAITVADTADATSFCGLFESATGDLGPKTDAGCTYDAATGLLTSTSHAVADDAYAAGWNGNLTVPTKNAVYDKIETLGSSTVSDTAYDATSWNGVTTIAPSKNAVRDEVEVLIASIPSAPSDTAYNAGTWDGVTTIAPSKNAVRDKIEAMTPSDTAYDATSWNGNLEAASKNAIRDKIETISAGANPGTTTGDTRYCSTTATPCVESRIAIGATGDYYSVVGGVPAWSTAGIVPNSQTGTTYTWLTGDRGKVVWQNNAAATAYTLPQAGSAGFTSNWYGGLFNVGAGLVTVTPATSTINGAATAIVPQNWYSVLHSDNTNYRAPIMPTIGAFPNCTDTGGNHLNFTSATGALSCGTSGGAAGARFTAGGDAVVAGDIALGAGWGSTAAVSAVTGHDQAFNFTVTTGGTGIAANPTFTMTFTDGTWTLSPIFQCQQTGGNDTLSDVTFTNGVTTATTIPGIWNGTPTTAKTYIITCIGVGR